MRSKTVPPEGIDDEGVAVETSGEEVSAAPATMRVTALSTRFIGTVSRRRGESFELPIQEARAEIRRGAVKPAKE